MGAVRELLQIPIRGSGGRNRRPSSPRARAWFESRCRRPDSASCGRRPAQLPHLSHLHVRASLQKHRRGPLERGWSHHRNWVTPNRPRGSPSEIPGRAGVGPGRRSRAGPQHELSPLYEAEIRKLGYRRSLRRSRPRPNKPPASSAKLAGSGTDGALE